MPSTAPPALDRPLPADPAAFRSDPHAGFAHYRPQAAVIDVGRGSPIITRHADVEALMTEPRTRQVETDMLRFYNINSGALHDFYANSMLFSNPPVHQRRRRPAARAFAYKLIEAWRPRIRTLVTELIDEAEPSGEADFAEAIAKPLPSRITADILGIERADAPRFAAMVYGMSRGISTFREEHFPAIEAAAGDLNAYVEGLLAARRAEPRDDFLTDYLRTVEADGSLSESETLMQIVSLIIAGSDTTRFGLTALVSLLMQHRDQWQAVCTDPIRAPGAVREALRFEPPVGSIGRVVLETFDIDGILLRPGALLHLSILSAQRDEAVYADPHRFDIERDDHPRWSVSFGAGPHRCLGEALARAEMEEALIALSQRLPDLQLAGPPPVFKGHSGIRGTAPMAVRWR